MDAAQVGFADFLRSQRARVRPEQVALRPYGRRRVPGLRREELSQLAGISLSYYSRMEQGKVLKVSDGILDAIAGVLRLSESEHAQLRALGGTPIRQQPPTARPRTAGCHGGG